MSKKDSKSIIKSYDEYIGKYYPKAAKIKTNVDLDIKEFGSLIARETLNQHQKIKKRRAS